MLIRSGAGRILGLTVLATAVLYGRMAASAQGSARRRWSDAQGLQRLTGVGFEHHVAETYERLGYHTDVTRGSRDQGVDVIATRRGERMAIQCKRWADAVGNDAVQQVHAGKTHYNCTSATVVCTSRFTAAAWELAQSVHVQLVDGDEYVSLMQSVQVQSHRSPWLPAGRPLLYQIGLAAIGGALILGSTYAPGPASPPAASAAIAAQPACSVYPASGGLDYYAYGSEHVMAPADGSCRGQISAQSTTIWVTTPEGTVTLLFAPGCVACVAGGSPPAGEQVVRLGPTSLAFEDPPDVAGQGLPSGGADPANGAIVTAPAFAAKETCTMPASEHSLCTVILNTFLRDHSD